MISPAKDLQFLALKVGQSAGPLVEYVDSKSLARGTYHPPMHLASPILVSPWAGCTLPRRWEITTPTRKSVLPSREDLGSYHCTSDYATLAHPNTIHLQTRLRRNYLLCRLEYSQDIMGQTAHVFRQVVNRYTFVLFYRSQYGFSCCVPSRADR